MGEVSTNHFLPVPVTKSPAAPENDLAPPPSTVSCRDPTRHAPAAGIAGRTRRLRKWLRNIEAIAINKSTQMTERPYNIARGNTTKMWQSMVVPIVNAYAVTVAAV